MQYKIEEIEQKEYEGRKYAKANIIALDGTEYEVSLGEKWGDRLFDLKEGDKVEGNVWQNPKNQKWSLYPPDSKSAKSSNLKSAQIKEVMDTKREDISRSMDRKEESIALMSAQRDAVLCAIAEQNADMYMKDTPAPLKDQIIKWRNWFLSDDFRNAPPF